MEGETNTCISSTSHEVHVDTRSYPVFRKSFYVPRRWMEIPQMNDLVNHRYLVVDAKDAFEYISSRLKEIGYDKSNQKMIHDFLHFTICDYLVGEEINFITETDLAEESPLKNLIKCTPDIILRRPGKKPLIIDIYVGNKDTQSIKSKYRALDLMFDFIIVTDSNLSVSLQEIFPLEKINRLFKDFQVFQTECQYWYACLKLQRIIFNDDAGPIVTPIENPSENFINEQVLFFQRLNQKALAMSVEV
jgi:hypothetical protein